MINCIQLKRSLVNSRKMQNVTPPAFFLSTPREPVIKWGKWKNIFAHYAKVCGTNLSAERQHSLLLHCLGGEGQEVLENLPDLSNQEQTLHIPLAVFGPAGFIYWSAEFSFTLSFHQSQHKAGHSGSDFFTYWFPSL